MYLLKVELAAFHQDPCNEKKGHRKSTAKVSQEYTKESGKFLNAAKTIYF